MTLVAAGSACKEMGSSRATLITTWTWARGALLIRYMLGGPTGPVLLLGLVGGTR
jgi:hypothetical protein